eukprot:3190555-Rhodomonas_salina.1
MKHTNVAALSHCVAWRRVTARTPAVRGIHRGMGLQAGEGGGSVFRHDSTVCRRPSSFLTPFSVSASDQGLESQIVTILYDDASKIRASAKWLRVLCSEEPDITIPDNVQVTVSAGQPPFTCLYIPWLVRPLTPTAPQGTADPPMPPGGAVGVRTATLFKRGSEILLSFSDGYVATLDAAKLRVRFEAATRTASATEPAAPHASGTCRALQCKAHRPAGFLELDPNFKVHIENHVELPKVPICVQTRLAPVSHHRTDDEPGLCINSDVPGKVSHGLTQAQSRDSEAVRV